MYLTGHICQIYFLFNRRIIQGSLFEYGPLLDVVPRAKVVHFDKKKFAGKHGL